VDRRHRGRGRHLCSPLLVVVDDLNVFGPCWRPADRDPPLLVDPDAVLPGAVAAQFLQSVAGRDLQVVEGLGYIQDQQRDDQPDHRAGAGTDAGVGEPSAR
jgi:hypothetical protein